MKIIAKLPINPKLIFFSACFKITFEGLHNFQGY